MIRVTLNLRAKGSFSLTAAHGKQVHGWFFQDLIGSRRPDLVERLHADSGHGDEIRPFTLSQIEGGHEPHRGGDLVFEAGVPCSLRLTGLDERTEEFLRTVADGLPGEVVLREARFLVDGARVCGTTFKEIWSSGEARAHRPHNGSRPTRRVALRFRSPTAFSDNRRNVLFPEPRLVFQSLAKKWNRFADASLRLGNAHESASQIREARYELCTERLKFETHTELGFIGWCEYEYDSGGRVERSAGQVVEALARFACFAGVGKMTSYGLGQTERIVPRSTNARGRAGSGPRPSGVGPGIVPDAG